MNASERRAQAAREKRAQAYREFLDWSKREVADSIIKHGFGELRGVIERILHAYRQLLIEHPL